MQLLQNNEQEQAGIHSLSPDRAFYGRDYDTPNLYDTARESRKCLVSRRPSYIHVTKITRSSSQVAGATHLGTLDQLPNEVITAILQYCSVRTLLSHVLRVNHAAYAIVKHLPGFVPLTAALRDNLARSTGHYTRIWSALIRISPYVTMRHLLESETCGKCGDAGAQLRPAHAKVLCDQCIRRPQY
ncbi:F-box domain-containing protein [Apiospora saccharicola]|uniref:F-box domain-containing protein n=1 Tax=Apiospora saccharicola TaxID=335842 RepID=A0ABR1TK15_9PEZI